jgi:hypothetical protein
MDELFYYTKKVGWKVYYQENILGSKVLILVDILNKKKVYVFLKVYLIIF